ncbi:MAG: 5-formyltetrahydrofolate cyclo-ligase [Burkholderiales bacterium]
MTKIQLRSELRRRRRSISDTDRKIFARQLVRHVLHSGFLLRYRRIGIYLPHGTEINTLYLMNKMLSLRKQVYLPMLPYGRGKKLWFNRIAAGQPWVLNRFGMTENRSRRPVRARNLDLIFMPLLGYDDMGYRLGTGGGYYDASLNYLSRRCHWRMPYLIGVSFSCQHLDDRLSPDPWDIPMNAILTERGLHRFPNAQDQAGGRGTLAMLRSC